MDKPISVGDLVMVVRPREECGCDKYVGFVFVVKYFETNYTICGCCGNRGPSKECVMVEGGFGFHKKRLKRLDHDALKDDVPTKEELNA